MWCAAMLSCCRYNYETKEMGDVITFVGTYGASRGQAAALTFYTFIGRWYHDSFCRAVERVYLTKKKKIS